MKNKSLISFVQNLEGNFIFIFFRKVLNTFPIFIRIAGFFINYEKKSANQSKIWQDESNYKTDFYSEITEGGPSFFINFVVGQTEKEDKILDICCNQGRFLLFLKKIGYESLYGFDIMKPAIETLKKNSLYNEDHFFVECIQARDYFKNKNDLHFDWAITYSATIELIHPEFDIFNELSRTVRKGVILALSENGHSYPRFYRHLLIKNGFEIVDTPRINSDITLIFAKKIYEKL